MRVPIKHALSRQQLPLIVAFGALTAFGVGLLGPFSAVFDLSAQFSAHWLVLAVLAAGACFVPRYAYSLLGLSLLISILAPSLVTKLYATVPANVGSAPQERSGIAVAPQRVAGLKLMVFNTYNPNNDVEAVWQEVRRHNADVVILIEFGPNKRALLAKMREAYPYHKSCEADWDCAIGLFSRLPAENFQLVRPRDDDGPSMVAADIRLGGRLVHVVGTHILSPNHGPRANFKELDYLARQLRLKAGPMVLAGDLNTTLWANAFDNFRRKSGLVHMGGLIPTWPVRPLPLPQIGIDHVFTSADLEVVDIRTGHAAGSDHLPLVATIEWR